VDIVLLLSSQDVVLPLELEADGAGRAPKVQRQHLSDQAASHVVAPFPLDLLRAMQERLRHRADENWIAFDSRAVDFDRASKRG
jgi:hypothetical protein